MRSQKKIDTNLLCSSKIHPLSHIYFCTNCASNNIPDLNNIFFCQDCHPQYKSRHAAHSFYKNAFDSTAFVRMYTDFKKMILLQTRSNYYEKYPGNQDKQMQESFKKEISSATVVFKPCLVSSSNPSKDQFAQKSYRQWLVKHKFWTQKAVSLELKREIDYYINSIFESQKTGGSAKNPWIFPINVQASADDSQKFDQDISDLRSSLRKIRKQQKLGDLFLQITSYFTNQEIEKGVAEINKIQKQPDALPYPFLLYLAKLKILELHSEGSQRMKKLLKEQTTPINGQRERQLFFYYSAIAEWKIVQQQNQQNKGSSYLFYEPRNKRYYKLDNPKNYIKNLEQAIKLSQDNKTSALYQAAKAIGHMVLQQYDEAELNFQKSKGIRNDATLCNNNFNNLKRRQQLNNTILRESLSERSTQYILNVSKHLKKVKQYKQLRMYYEQLVHREPQNLSFRVKRFENFIKLKHRESAIDQLADIKKLAQSTEQQILEYQRKIELLKAKEVQDFNYSDAESKFEHVASTGKASATNWYNYAAFLFKHRDERQKNERALMAINKALQIKSKPHFYELKYLLLFLSGSLEQARKIHTFIEHASQKFKIMIQHVNYNI